MKLQIYFWLIFNHLAFIYALSTFNGQYFLLTLLGILFFGKIGGEIGLHRFFAHHSFKTSPTKTKLLGLLACYNFFGPPLSWVAYHRKHHEHSDTDLDPHGHLPLWKVWWTFWRPIKIETKVVKDLMRDRFQIFLFKRYLMIVSVPYILLLIIDPKLSIYLFSIPAVITFHSAGLVNTLCHKYGYRNYDTLDNSYNNTWVNFFTLGSGLHNNHHGKPQSYTNKVLKGEIDFPGWIIRSFFI